MSDLPRVTDILRAVGLSLPPPGSASDLERARRRGATVHAAIEGIVYGFDGPMTPEAAPYIDAYRKFVAESGFKAERAEFEVMHVAWGYQGHPDLLGWLLTKRIIIDAKTGDEAGVAYQLAGYRAAWNEQHPTEAVEAIASLKLNDNGTYRFHEHDLAEAERVWFAALTVYQVQGR